MHSQAQLSIIIPTLNEAIALPRLLTQLQSQRDIELDIIVADGGSSDATLAIAQANNARVVTSEPGRGRQMNAALEHCRFNMLLFLHADSGLDHETLLIQAHTQLEAEQARLKTDRVAGHFALRFEGDKEKHPLAYRYMEEKSRTNRPHTINGDQGLLITKNYFIELGGFDEEFGFMEDQAIAAKIFASGHWLLLPGHLLTSARRFEVEGFHRRYLLMSLMMGLYWTNAREFFARAKHVYREQGRTEILKLSPYFNAVWAMLIKDFGFKRSLRQWFLVGRYVRQNAWQLFFWFDVLKSPRSNSALYPFTQFYDKYIKPLISNAVCDGIITLIVFIWYMLILAPCYFILDRLPQRGLR